MKHWDVIIIGAGLMGSFVARHLAKRGYSVLVLERENDVSMGISRANTAIVYAGYDMKPETLKARLTVSGTAAFESLCDELSVDFVRTGSLMMASGPRGTARLAEKLKQGVLNGVPGLCMLDAGQIQSLEPGVSTDVTAALFAPSTGTVNPWDLCLAAAQDARQSGAEFLFEHEVISIREGFIIECLHGVCFSASAVVNCAGIAADKVSELLAPADFRLELSSGSYLVLDTTAKGAVNHVVFYEPETKGKGATFVPTTEGNLLLGPSEEKFELSDDEPGYITTACGLDFVHAKSREVFPELPLHETIRSFGTIRPNIKHADQLADGTVVISDESIHDFHISWANNTPGLLNIAGVKTPGLTCADGIGRYAADMVHEYLTENACVSPASFGSEVLTSDVSAATNNSPGFLGSNLPASGNKEAVSLKMPLLFDDDEIICRCKQITAAEVRASIRSGLGAQTVDGIKRRVGCGMGRCQGGFCMERVMLLLSEELGLEPKDILKDREGSWIVGGAPHQLSVPEQDAGGFSSAHIPSGVSLLIIGGGAAGLAAASAAVSAGLPAHEILLVDRLETLGGILPQCSHHGFGERDHGGTLSGPEFLAPLLEEFFLSNIPVRLRTTVTSLTADGCATLVGPAGKETLRFESVIFAAGCREQTLGSLPVAGSRPSGILTAGAAQRMVNLRHWDIGERIIILGGGDVGMIMAGTLTQQGKQILALIEQNEKVGGLKANKQRYLDATGIPLLTKSTITNIFGHRRIEGVEICTSLKHPLLSESTYRPTKAEDLLSMARGEFSRKAGLGNAGFAQDDQAASYTLACDTLIVSVGLIPETDLLRELSVSSALAQDASLAPDNSLVSPCSGVSLPYPPWLFLAGNARRVHSFIEGVVADGHAAGIRAAEYLASSAQRT